MGSSLLDYVKSQLVKFGIFLSYLPKPTWSSTALSSLVSVFIILNAAHFNIISNEALSLKKYSNDVAKRNLQVSFQAQKVLTLGSELSNKTCDINTLSKLRRIVSRYHYIEDIGITDGNTVRCSAAWGKLNTPIRLPKADSDNADGQGLIFWRFSAFLTGEFEKRTLFQNKNIIVSLSPAAYLAINRRSTKTGAVMYNDNTGFVYSILDDVPESYITKAINHKPSFYSWLPFPNSYITHKQCDHSKNHCSVVMDRKLGLYTKPYTYLATLTTFGIILGISIAFLIQYRKFAPKALLNKLRFAIKRELIFPLYQPKIHLETGRIVGFEALARWIDDSDGFISPEDFIPLAEQHGDIKNLTQLIFRTVLRDLHTILEQDREMSVNINVSAFDLADLNFFDFIYREMSLYDIHNDQIVFEVTERTAMDHNILISSAKRLARDGYKLSLDDFGTGFSNLSWLSSLEPDEVKIDKMFTQAIGTQTVNKITLDGIFQLLKALDTRAVFEGIETKEELEYILSKAPTSVGQGWYYCKAVEISKLEKMLKEQPYLTYKKETSVQ
ncbi:EAL domain-containing protein [Marinomonas balearica]|uniref:cyclic-guanylate-specific phosphodiesterase n=1 Tax=Marinomonas balearica TaxID=491947 RepID=A0A4R6M4Y9_9GAMM|nr:EAL domain-containing protein [Marinomonas balearica]TDO95805.1 sensor c-di-GMP phosphodiesterase-like protein [Marinomonas balearica]